MLKKLLLLSFALIFIASFVNATPRITKEQIQKYSISSYTPKLVGEHVVFMKNKKDKGTVNIGRVGNPPDYAPAWVLSATHTVINTGLPTVNDSPSNTTPKMMTMNPASNMIHVALQHCPVGDNPSNNWPNRKSKYYKSTNFGSTWTFMCDVPSGLRSGFSAVDLLPNGAALIANHCVSASEPSSTRTRFFYDAVAGLGSFTQLDPPLVSTNMYIWPRVVATGSATNTNKFLSISSINNTAYDSAFLMKCTNLTSPGTFSSWTPFDAARAEEYQMARGDNGRIGIAYLPSYTKLPNDEGSLFFVESTNNGETFGTPVKIFNANITPTGDSMAVLQCFQLVYNGTVPNVVFEVCKRTSGISYQYYFNDPRNCIRFWNTSLPGSDPNRSIKIADTSNAPHIPYYNQGTGSGDGFTIYCNPTIGRSKGGKALFVAYLSPAGDGAGNPYVFEGAGDTLAFMRMYLTYSTDGGLHWCQNPKVVTPFDTTSVTTMKEHTFLDMCPVNDSTPGFYAVNIVSIRDSVPGTFFAHEANGYGLGDYVFTRVLLNVNQSIGVNNISSSVPNKYLLAQNFPNPFNPVTSIRFNLPKNTNVTMKVYDITGKLVNVLVNNETLTAGEKEVKFDATNLASGVYFYSIKAGDFSDTKKMVVVK